LTFQVYAIHADHLIQVDKANFTKFFADCHPRIV
jgi:hypothetical protein